MNASRQSACVNHRNKCTSRVMSLTNDEDVRAIFRHPWYGGAPSRIIGTREEPLILDKNDLFYKYRTVTLDVEYDYSSETVKSSHKFLVKVLQCREDSESSEPLTLQNVLADESTMQEEVYFFDKLCPQPWGPECFLAMPDALVFDYFLMSTYKLRWDEHHDEETVKAILRTLAYFHAASLSLEVRLDEPLNVVHPNAFREKVFAGTGRHARATKIGFETLALLAAKFGMDASKMHRIHEYVCEIVKPKEGNCNIVCHGNLHRSSVAFRRGDDAKLRCILLNYELLRYASLTTDLAVILHSRVAPEILEEIENDLVEQYTASLRGALLRARVNKTKAPSYEAIRADYDANKLMGMACAALEWPPGVLDGLTNDPVALEKWFFHSRIDHYLAIMDKDPDYENRMKSQLKRLLSEAERMNL